jgi:ParB family chromosome partitioning protein
MSDSITKPIKPRVRRSVKKSSTDELFAQVQSGQHVSSDKDLVSVRANVARQNEHKGDESTAHGPVVDTIYRFESVLLDYLQPNPKNPREFLILSASNDNSDKKGVSFTKGDFTIHCQKSDPDYKSIVHEVEQIIRLAKQLEKEDLIQPITVWQRSTSNYPIISGHRRYCALIFLFGVLTPVKIKIYNEEPAHPSTLTFIENNQRKSLNPLGLITSFTQAYNELTSDSSVPKTSSNLIQHLGMSKTNYYRYKSITEFLPVVTPLLEREGVISFKELEWVLNQIKNFEVIKRDKLLDLFVKQKLKNPSLDSKKVITTIIDSHDNEAAVSVTPSQKGRKSKYFQFPKVMLTEKESIERLFKEDVTKIDCGVDWKSINFGDASEVKAAFEKLITHFTK